MARPSPTAPPLFGAHAERLAQVQATIEDRVGHEQLRAWIEQGSRLRDDEVLEVARTAVAAPPPGGSAG